MIIEGNTITLYVDETHLQPTAPNSFIRYTFEDLQNQYTEGLFVSRESYRRIKQIFHNGYSEILIQVNGYIE